MTGFEQDSTLLDEDEVLENINKYYTTGGVSEAEDGVEIEVKNDNDVDSVH
jgi:hypothetical protein